MYIIFIISITDVRSCNKSKRNILYNFKFLYLALQGMVLNDPYAKHVGSVITNPFNCEFCYRQYASRGKLLNHHRKEHSNLLPPEIKVRF